ncbi:SH3 domain-binding glutamic acid-rich-like protein 2 [Lates japonicus]|uniref:SH3 domain-binding glutamic acid-rich-like protein 2 n=1 Tax=Lates japonicus TaxID=270547 RepID=A0AAD3N5S3_LATJO|nr:SH3 domain-binding glutamic acid-rich-like protein 2 [Lates japonicus]
MFRRKRFDISGSPRPPTPPAGRASRPGFARQRQKNGDVKKHQQAVVGFLEANRISFQEIDITMLEEQRLWMYRNIPRDKRPEKGNPLPPQIFNEDRYCGDYEDFFQSKENNTVFAFLGLSSQPSVKDSES